MGQDGDGGWKNCDYCTNCSPENCCARFLDGEACLLACLLACFLQPLAYSSLGVASLGLRRALSYSSQWTAPFRGLQADGRCCCGKSCTNTVRLVSGHLVWNSYVDCMVYDCHGDSRLPVES